MINIKAGKQQRNMDDSGDYGKAQVLSLGQVNNIRQITPYGYFCSPPIDSTWIIFSLRNNPDDLTGYAHDFSKRMKDLQPGELGLANTETGAYIKLDKDGNINIYSPAGVNVNCNTANITAIDKITVNAKDAEITASDTITIDCPATSWTGDINLTGNIAVSSGDVTADGISLKTHVHGGVTTGGGNTGVPA